MIFQSKKKRIEDGKKLHGKVGQLLRSLNAYLAQYNRYSHTGVKVISNTTQRDRERVLAKACRDLHELGYKICDISNLRTTHIKKLAAHWEKEGLTGGTIINRLSMLSTLCNWIGKPGMVGSPVLYAIDPVKFRRSGDTLTDKTWSEKGVSIEDKIAEVEQIDRAVGMQLRLQWAFSLRAQESWLLRPVMADRGAYLDINWGTKGGRARTVPIENELQRTVLEMAKSMVNNRTGSTIPKEYALRQWENHYYYVIRSAGISRKEGITSHGLRHEGANAYYQSFTGHPSPIKGGTPGAVDDELDTAARLDIAERLGHGRKQITGAYIGARRGV